jgi:coenzyme F420-reducing hydrogenase delta subunit
MKANGKVPRYDILDKVLNRIGNEEAQLDTVKASIEELEAFSVRVFLEAINV